MGIENQPEDLEIKRREFFAKVDAGEFDSIITARKAHEDEQFSERVERHFNPTTADELIASVNEQEEMDEIDRELKRDVHLDPKRFEEATERGWQKMQNRRKRESELGHTGLLRDGFKKDPRNFERYLQGKL